MKLIFIITLASLVNYIYCTKLLGSLFEGYFLELNNVDKNNDYKTFMITNFHCTEMYMCKGSLTLNINPFLSSKDLSVKISECYYRNNKIDIPSYYYDPDGCDVKGYAEINSENCYFTNSGSEIIKGKTEHPRARYYDIDLDNGLALTEYGWCKFNLSENDDKWMSKLDLNLKLNEINIPGTHDSGTYWTWPSHVAQTQNLDIHEQLLNGIRYLDIRLAKYSKDDEIHITHNGFDVLNRKTNKLYYLKEVFDECIDFLHKTNETVIIHLKEDSVSKDSNIVQSLAEISVLNNKKIFDKPYSDYFYKYCENSLDCDYHYNATRIPTLGEVRGQIVLFSRQQYNYASENGNLPISIHLDIPDMGECDHYNPVDFPDNIINDGDLCYPIVTNNNTTRIQDNYNLNDIDKWRLVSEMLDHEIGCRTEKISVDKNSSSSFKNEYTVFLKNNTVTENFYNTTRKDVLTINFMNVAFNGGSLVEGLLAILDIYSLSDKAEKINNYLSDYINKSTRFHNIWFILDYPSNDIIRKIYRTNFIKEQLYDKATAIIDDNYTVYTDYDYGFVPQTASTLKRSEQTENPKACLQRKIVTDKQGNQQDLVKTNYRCIRNKLNKWRISQNDNYYKIISSYDGKCLNYSNDVLHVQECEENNVYEDFTIKNGEICAKFDNSKCIDGTYEITPTVLESAKYDHLTCSTIFAKIGFDCCSNQNTQVEYVDKIGNWGIENGELCGIGYERCLWSAFGYPCCSSVNPEIKERSALGLLGIEDGERCGIDEPTYDTRIRIKNKKTQECLITNLHSDTNVVLMGDCNHSEWIYQNDLLVLEATGKCLYAMNSLNARMIECSKSDEQINHQIHFKIVDNRYICIKNNVNPEDHCLDGKTLNFETSKSEFSEWYIEVLNGKIIDSIEEIIKNNPSLHKERINYPNTTTSNTSATTTTIKPTSSNCYFENLGYPCCSDENTQVEYVDENGKWGIENNDWCGIDEKIFTTSEIITTTSTSIATAVTTNTSTSIATAVTTNTSTPIVPTLDSKAKPVYLYNTKLNECLVAQVNLDKKPKIHECGEYTNHKWYIDPYPTGYIRSYAFPERCITILDAPNGKVKVSNCTINDDGNNIFEVTNEGFIKSTLTDECLGKGDKLNDPTNADGGYLKSCTNADDQLWQMREKLPNDFVNTTTSAATTITISTTTSIATTIPTNTSTSIATAVTTSTSTSVATAVTTNISTPSVPTLDSKAKPVYLYNIKLNECLVAQVNLDKKPKIHECGEYTNHKWYIDPYPTGYIRSYAFPERCITILDAPNGKVKVSNCTINDDGNNIFEVTNEGFIKSTLTDECLGKGDKLNDPTNADGGYLKSCTNADDQLWQMWEKFPYDFVNTQNKTVWIYNSKLKKCIYSGNEDTFRPYMGDCNKTNKDNIWIVPVSLEGFYISGGKNFCFTVTDINNGTVINTNCNNKSIIGYNKNNKSIYSTLDEKKCLGLLNNEENKLAFNDCDTNKNDQFWEIVDSYPL